MGTANIAFVPRLFFVWAGGADDDELAERFRGFNANDEVATKAAIAHDVLPDYVLYSDRAKTKAKYALAYVLTVTDGRYPELASAAKRVWRQLDLRDMFPALLFPFDGPADLRNLLLWTWEVLFPGEDYLLQEPQTNFVNNDTVEVAMRYKNAS